MKRKIRFLISKLVGEIYSHSGYVAIAVFSILLFPAFSLAQALQYEWGLTMSGNGISTLGGSCAGIALDLDQNVYIVGTFQDTVDFDPGPGVSELIPLDINGNGANNVTIENAFIAKYNSDGEFIWVKAIRGNGFFWGTTHSIAIDGTGNILITGDFRDSSDFDPGSGTEILVPPPVPATHQTFIAKYDVDGNFKWVKEVGSAYGDWTAGISIDNGNNIYVTGTFYDTMDFDPGTGTALLVSTGGQDNFIAKYDSNGNYQWAHRMGSNSTSTENGTDVAVDLSGNVISVGSYYQIATFSSTTFTLPLAGNGNGYIMKHDSLGNFLWAINVGSAGNYSYCQSVDVDKAGNIYVAGAFRGPADFDPGPDTAILTPNGFLADGFLAKYDADGNYLWAIHAGGGVLTTFNEVAVDEIDNVYITGFFMGTADFDSGPDTFNLTAGGNTNGFVARYNATNGHFLWAGAIESPVTSQATNLTVSPYGTVFAGGCYVGTVDLDPGIGSDSYSTGINNEVFLLKLSCGGADSTYIEEVVCDSTFTFNGETFTNSGTYIQHFPNLFHCDSMIVLALTIEPMDPPVITVNGFILSTTQTYASYQWIKDGVSMPGETNSTLQVTENADYQVNVSNDAGCEVLSAIYTVNNVDIMDVGRASQIRVYPNPAQDVVYIHAPISVNVTLMGVEGRIIREVKQANSVSVGDLPAGVYLLKIMDARGEGMKVERLVIQK